MSSKYYSKKGGEISIHNSHTLTKIHKWGILIKKSTFQKTQTKMKVL